MVVADNADSLNDLEDDESFETLSSKMAVAFFKILTGEFRREVELKEEVLESEHPDKPFLNGRQLYFLICQRFKRCFG